MGLQTEEGGAESFGLAPLRKWQTEMQARTVSPLPDQTNLFGCSRRYCRSRPSQRFRRQWHEDRARDGCFRRGLGQARAQSAGTQMQLAAQLRSRITTMQGDGRLPQLIGNFRASWTRAAPLFKQSTSTDQIIGSRSHSLNLSANGLRFTPSCQSLTTNLKAAGQVLNLFLDQSIADRTPFSKIKQKAFSLLDPERFALVADYMRD